MVSAALAMNSRWSSGQLAFEIGEFCRACRCHWVLHDMQGEDMRPRQGRTNNSTKFQWQVREASTAGV